LAQKQTKYDPIDSIIQNGGIRIKHVDVRKDMNLLFVQLNNDLVLGISLINYPLLKKAKAKDILNFKINAGGTGIHWPTLDEDLSLRGFLKDTLVRIVNKEHQPLVLS
jgi:hypothetical protein